MMTDGIPDEALLAATYKIVSENDNWPPTIGMLRTTALAIATGSLAHPTGIEAWERVVKTMVDLDVSDNDFGPRTQRALKMIGGLHALRYTESESGARFQTDRALFIKAFDTIVQRDKEQRELLPLVRDFINAVIREKSQEIKTPELPEASEKQDDIIEN
jgi:hypothetical protein